MPEVEFEDSGYLSARRAMPDGAKGMPGFLMKCGIVKSAKGAQALLLGLAVAAFSLSLFLFIAFS